MEFFDQGYGSILYRTTLPEVEEGETLLITEANAWAQVFVDGKHLATLSRMKGEGAVALPAIKAGAVLDILVEPMGRMTLGAGIYYLKGMTEKVDLQVGDQI